MAYYLVMYKINLLFDIHVRFQITTSHNHINSPFGMQCSQVCYPCITLKQLWRKGVTSNSCFSEVSECLTCQYLFKCTLCTSVHKVFTSCCWRGVRQAGLMRHTTLSGVIKSTWSLWLWLWVCAAHQKRQGEERGIDKRARGKKSRHVEREKDSYPWGSFFFFCIMRLFFA